MDEGLTPAALRKLTGISASYASMILSGQRAPSMPLALRIFRRIGHKLGPLANATDEQIEALSSMYPDTEEAA